MVKFFTLAEQIHLLLVHISDLGDLANPKIPTQRTCFLRPIRTGDPEVQASINLTPQIDITTSSCTHSRFVILSSRSYRIFAHYSHQKSDSTSSKHNMSRTYSVDELLDMRNGASPTNFDVKKLNPVVVAGN